MEQKIIGYFRLMRPANIVTAVADILAGIAISGFFLNDILADLSSMILWIRWNDPNGPSQVD
jgi:4-hydroxybenzoate polyprenyltransferase